jgi:signal peptide peptidase SppA
MPFDAVLSFVAEYPWAIEPSAGRRVADILTRRLAGERPSPAAIAEAAEIRAARDKKKQRAKPPAVAVIPLYGPMVPKADFFMEASGLLSTQQVGAMVDVAANDPAVDAIVLDVDSPGGSVFGTAELAGKVAAAAKAKKVIAVANSLMASAAYYVGSQASELVASPSAMVGSIGVYTMHVDRSAELAAAGVKVTLISSTPEKVAANEFNPLDELGMSAETDVVMGYYREFVRTVADGRRVSQAKVRDEFGKGGVVLAKDAVARGMADRVATLDEVLGRYGLHTSDLMPVGASAGAGADLELRRRKLRVQ